jgi:ATP-dependent Clp protease ATP-binding subunit ClpC
MPDKAIDVMDEAGVGYTGDVVTPERIAEVVSHMSGIPVTRITGSGGERALLLEKHLNESVLGQGEACRQLAHTYVRRQAGLGDPSRPDSFFFVGGTGVGKTEMCKALAEFLYGDSDKLIFVDMSQYMDPHSVSRLIGAPPGYIGHEEGGELTNKVRRAPFSVVVLDEFERAHPHVAKIFLQVLEEGHLTDGSGRKIDFRNTTVIATSNIGTAQSSDSSGGGMGFANVVADHNLDGAAAKAKAREHFRSSVLDALPPELFDRFGAVVTFDSLGYEIQQQILAKELEELNQRDGLVTQNLRIEVEPAAQAWILKRGFNRAFGARNLRRAIQDMVEVPLSDLLISDLPAPGSVIKVRLKDSQLTLHAVKGKTGGEGVVRPTPRKVGVRS